MELNIRNGYANNLKHVDVTIPHHKLVVLTGVSGSGKSSLAFDLIANAGSTAFLENIPGFVRQFGAKKKEVLADEVSGMFPVITIGQQTGGSSSTSTFGTFSGTYDLMRLWFARFGSTHRNDEQLSRSLFSFNTKEGACPKCKGIGEEEHIAVEKLIADPSKSLREGALVPTQPNGYTMYSQVTVDALNEVCMAHGFTVDIPWSNLSEEQQNVVLNGSDRVKIPFGKHSEASRLKWKGIKAKPREKGLYRGMLPIMTEILKRDRNANILRFVNARVCSECGGKRLSEQARSVTVRNRSIIYYAELPLIELMAELNKLEVEGKELQLIAQLVDRVQGLIELGLGHHALSTPTAELSQGERQRVRLLSQLKLGLTNVLYIFDEPGIGLHPAFQAILIEKFRRLVNEGNSVILVEHNPAFIQSADWIIELGPLGGKDGGAVLFNGPFEQFAERNSQQANRESDVRSIRPDPIISDRFDSKSKFRGLTVITGVNGSGRHRFVAEEMETFEGIVNRISRGPIGKTPRSNPATYTGLSEELRNLFASQQQAKSMGLKRTHFSFNTPGGRCETCLGAGVVSVGMSYLGAVSFICEACNGNRFNEQVLSVSFNKKNIAQVYALTVDEAIKFFGEQKKIMSFLSMLSSIGLGYLALGQPSSTLSGGEAQRLKLAAKLSEQKEGIIILDEPTNGLHSYDLQFLRTTFERLISKGYAIVCIDFNIELLSWANRIVELDQKGEVLFDGAFNAFIASENSFFVRSLIGLNHSDDLPAKTHQFIELKGVRTHNLKGIDVQIPIGKLTSIVGKSGSGKTSLAIDTLFGIANDRYLAGLTSYQRNRIDLQTNADFSSATGLTPTLALQQTPPAESPWQIVAKSLGVFERLRFLFSRVALLEGQSIPASAFNFTSSAGACPACGGKGTVKLADRYKLAPDWSRSLLDGAFEHSKTLAYYGGPSSQYVALLKRVCDEQGIDLSLPLSKLDVAELNLLFDGSDHFVTAEWTFVSKTRSGTETVSGKWKGLSTYINEEYLARKANKNIRGVTELMTDSLCNSCNGDRFNERIHSIQLEGISLPQVLKYTIDQFIKWVQTERSDPRIELLFSQFRSDLLEMALIADKLGMHYISLNRSNETLSGGEYQRVMLAQLLGKSLLGLTIVLDEPCSGLDEPVSEKVIESLKELAAKGTTVVTISHHQKLIEASDHMIEIGPGSGKNGGEIVYSGQPTFPRLIRNWKYDFNPLSTSIADSIVFQNIEKHVVKIEEVELKMGRLNLISGVSGAGKSTLLNEVILPTLTARTPVNCEQFSAPYQFGEVRSYHAHHGRFNALDTICTQGHFFDLIQKLYVTEAKKQDRPFKRAHFDYRTKEGRCEQCHGRGIELSMLDILAENALECEACRGKRYATTVDLELGGKSIAELMRSSLEELDSWLKNNGVSSEDVTAMLALGLGHVSIGQQLSTLSKGELQRINIANVMEKGDLSKTMIGLDEPTQGLHEAEIELLLNAFQALIQKGATIVLVDHHRCFNTLNAHRIVLAAPKR